MVPYAAPRGELGRGLCERGYEQRDEKFTELSTLMVVVSRDKRKVLCQSERKTREHNRSLSLS